jgi:hypothetical protein
MKKHVLVLAAIAALLGGSCALSSSEEAEWRDVSQSEPFDLQREVTCSVHHVATRESIIPAFGGMSVMPPRSYVRARIRAFPNSWLYVNTGWCEQGAVLPVSRWYCPECRRAELRWRRVHRYPLPQQISKETGDWTGR